MKTPRHTRSEKWTKVGGFAYPFATFDGQNEYCYVVDFAQESISPLTWNLGVAPETAQQFGLQVRLRLGNSDPRASTSVFDPYAQADFGPILAHWLPLAVAMNNLNRSMGHDHAYRFVLPTPAIEKLGSIHRIVQAQRSRS